MSETNQNETTQDESNTTKGTKSNYRNRQSRSEGGKKKRYDDNKKARFAGDTPDMLGHVFQVHSEQRTRGQFQDTLDQLKIYASTNYKKEVKHMRKLFTDIETPNVTKPKMPRTSRRKARTVVTTRGQRQSSEVAVASTEEEGSEDNLETVIYAEEVKTYVKEKRNLEAALASLFNIVWGQCSKLMKHRIMASEEYDEREENCDVAWLLREIRKISNEVGTNVSVYYAQHEAIKRFYSYYQNEDDSIATHLKNFKTMVAVVEHYGGDVFFDIGLIRHEKSSDKKKGADEKTDKEYRQIVRDRKMAMAFLLSANKKIYGSLLDKLSDSLTCG